MPHSYYKFTAAVTFTKPQKTKSSVHFQVTVGHTLSFLQTGRDIWVETTPLPQPMPCLADVTLLGTLGSSHPGHQNHSHQNHPCDFCARHLTAVTSASHIAQIFHCVYARVCMRVCVQFTFLCERWQMPKSQRPTKCEVCQHGVIFKLPTTLGLEFILWYKKIGDTGAV